MGKGLVLRRKTGDRIYIGNDIEIVFESVNGGQADVAIIAPPHVKIHRDAQFAKLKIAASIKKEKGR